MPATRHHFTSFQGPSPSFSSVCASLAGRNLKVCQPGQQCKRKPEADAAAAPAAEGHGTCTRFFLRPMGEPPGGEGGKEQPPHATSAFICRGPGFHERPPTPCPFALSNPGDLQERKALLLPLDPAGRKHSELWIVVLSGALLSYKEHSATGRLPFLLLSSSTHSSLRSCCHLGLATSWAPFPDGNASIVSFAHVVAQDEVGQNVRSQEELIICWEISFAPTL